MLIFTFLQSVTTLSKFSTTGLEGFFITTSAGGAGERGSRLSVRIKRINKHRKSVSVTCAQSAAPERRERIQLFATPLSEYQKAVKHMNPGLPGTSQFFSTYVRRTPKNKGDTLSVQRLKSGGDCSLDY